MRRATHVIWCCICKREQHKCIVAFARSANVAQIIQERHDGLGGALNIGQVLQKHVVDEARIESEGAVSSERRVVAGVSVASSDTECFVAKEWKSRARRADC
jgi:hypothetical protein